MVFKVGRVAHYYDKLGIAIVELDAPIAVGDSIKFVKGRDELFTQVVKSIQVEHEKRESAGKGSVVGLATKEPVEEGADIYKA